MKSITLTPTCLTLDCEIDHYQRNLSIKKYFFTSQFGIVMFIYVLIIHVRPIWAQTRKDSLTILDIIMKELINQPMKYSVTEYIGTICKQNHRGKLYSYWGCVYL